MNCNLVPADKVAVKYDTWYQTLGKFIGDVNSNSYDINNLKYILDVSTKDLDLDTYKF